MFDYIHTDIKEKNVSEILSNSLLDFISPVSTTTGEINPLNRERKKSKHPPKVQQKADLSGMTVSVTNGTYINLQGSIHEYFHGNNSGDFTFSEVKKAIENICSALNIDSGLTPLHNLEFGVNIVLPFPVVTFLNSIFCLKGQQPERNSHSGKGLTIKFIFGHYELKLYDKGKQRGLNENVLRVEIKVRRMQYLQAKGLPIKVLHDLLNESYHIKLKGLLVNAINSLVISEKRMDRGRMTSNEKRISKDCSNPLYWYNLWEDKPTMYRKRLTRFKEINYKYGLLKIQSKVSTLVGQKWDELTLKSGTDITEVVSQDTSAEFQQISTSGTDVTLLIIGNISTPPIQRHCKSCGRDISHQHPRSVFCSEKIFGAEGKKCRNWDSNPRNNFRKRESKIKVKGLLFDIMPYIKVT